MGKHRYHRSPRQHIRTLKGGKKITVNKGKHYPDSKKRSCRVDRRGVSKKRVKIITVRRAEGITTLVDKKPRKFGSFADANDYLRQISYTIPEYQSGYDKTDVVITWSDGQTYTGRFDVKADGSDTNIERHMREMAAHIKESPVTEYVTAKEKKESAELMRKYRLSD